MMAVDCIQRHDMTQAQVITLRSKWGLDDCGKTWDEFLESATKPLGSDGYIMVHWAGMWLGIEPNGYAHS